MDKSIHEVAWDPLVAAYPSVSVGIEKLIISNNSSFSVSTGKTISNSVSSSIGTTNTVSIGAKAEIGLFNFSASVSTDYSHTSTQTVDKSQTSGQNWGQDLNIKEGESAYINANVRYYNTGTAPIYNLKPTVNLILDGDTISTITAQANQTSLSLGPDKVYPREYHNGITFNTEDEFNAVPIPVNLNQLNRLEKGGVIKLETTQFKGEFLKRTSDGGQVINEGNEWAYYLPQIENMTAGIIVHLPDGRTIERRVAARRLIPNDLTPELTLGEALKRAFSDYFKEGSDWTIINDKTNKEYSVNPLVIHAVYDKATERLIEKEMKRRPASFYDMIIRPGMNIQINSPDSFDMFDGPNVTHVWRYGRCIYEDNALLLLGTDITLFDLEKGYTLPKHKYLISMDVKPYGNSNITLTLTPNSITNQAQSFNLNAGVYTRVMAVFDQSIQLNKVNFHYPESVLIDNLSIHKLT